VEWDAVLEVGGPLDSPVISTESSNSKDGWRRSMISTPASRSERRLSEGSSSFPSIGPLICHRPSVGLRPSGLRMSPQMHSDPIELSHHLEHEQHR
jgi:hypothetical protein